MPRCVIGIGAIAGLFCLTVAIPARAQDAATRLLRGIAIDRQLDAEPLAANLAGPVPVIVRLSIGSVPRDNQRADAVFTQVEQQLNLYQARGISVMLALGRFPEGDAAVDEWSPFIHALAE